MDIARLNMRITFPQIGVRHTEAKLEMQPAYKGEIHSKYTPPKGYGWTQPRIEIDSYPSRHTYGYSNHEDYARERGQEGLQKMRENMRKNNADAQAMVKNGAKKGHNEIAAQEKQRQKAQSAPPQGTDFFIPPSPTITLAEKSENSGEIDPGSYENTITPAASIVHGQFTPAQVETYMKQEGNIDRWITYGEYDKRY